MDITTVFGTVVPGSNPGGGTTYREGDYNHKVVIAA
jgi:hypothetical protein